MRYVVAVSGGIDSVVLLDMLVRAGGHQLIVAHFDHGIRSDSAADARFVGGLAAAYDLPFATIREELGAGAGEALCRQRRYRFLRHVARQYQAEIVTAHHADDVIETMAINSSRGTGWRGVAVLDGADVGRPLLRHSKQAIRLYALEHRLEWVEDHTNGETTYLRNRLRRILNAKLPAAHRSKLLAIWRQQLALKKDIDVMATSLLPEAPEYSRYFFSNIDERSAYELLRLVTLRENRRGATRPQLARALLAIKTAQPSSTLQLGDGVSLHFTKRNFIVETPRAMV